MAAPRSYVPREFITELLNRTDIVNLIDSLLPGPLKKTGSNYSAACPFHDEKTPSFSVSAPKQFYYCFGCGASGNAISFLMDYEKLSFRESVSKLAQQAGLTIPNQQRGPHALSQNKQTDFYQLMADVNQYYQQQLQQHPAAQAAKRYLQHRKLNPQIIQQYQLGFAPPGWDNLLKHFKSKNHKEALLATGMLVNKENSRSYDRYRNRITFPIHDKRGRVIGFGGRVISDKDTPKYLNSPETALFHKRQELYGLYQAVQAKRHIACLLVVEGYMDVVSLAQYGIDYAVATLGTSTTEDHIKLLARYSQQIIFCFDGDAAGQTAAWRALETTLPVLTDDLQVQFMFLSQGEDPDSLIRKIGKSSFEQKIAQASTLSAFMYTHLTKSLNLDTMDGKSKLVKLASPLLNKMTAQTLRHLMLSQLSKLVRIDIDRLNHLITTQNTVQPPSSTRNQQPLSTIQLATALLLQNPHLAKLIAKNEKTAMLGEDEGKILLKLVDLLRHNPHLTTAALVERWRDQAEFMLINKLASWQHHVPHKGIAAEFTGAITRLIQLKQTDEVNKLLRQANTQGLTDTQRQTLQQLIKNRQINNTNNDH